MDKKEITNIEIIDHGESN